MTEKVAMCLRCRREFTEVEIEGANACPGCGSDKTPADPRHTMTATLTEHEWRILGMWAHRWGERCAKDDNPVDGILGEVRRQNPQAPPLTVGEEIATVAAMPGVSGVEVVGSDGTKRSGKLQ